MLDIHLPDVSWNAKHPTIGERFIALMEICETKYPAVNSINSIRIQLYLEYFLWAKEDNAGFATS